MCSGRTSCSCSIYASCFELFRYYIQGIVDIHPIISFYHQLVKRRHFFSEYQPFYLCSVWSQYIEQQTMTDLTCLWEFNTKYRVFVLLFQYLLFSLPIYPVHILVIALYIANDLVYATITNLKSGIIFFLNKNGKGKEQGRIQDFKLGGRT